MAIINPFSDRLTVVPGTRILQDSFGLVGCSFEDPREPERVWVVVGAYAPIASRAVSGIRARVLDQKGFVSFCNQRDLEVLLGLTKGGQYCPWMGCSYSYVNDEADGWIGLCVDEVDLLDDLFERELVLREQHAWGVLTGSEVLRRVHRSRDNDVSRRDILMWDADPITGLGPDPSLANIQYRWRRVEEEKVKWNRL